MSTEPAARDRAIAAHRTTWGEPEVLVRAPGRVNLIGEHTDYNDGFVLPMALPFDTVIALGRVGGDVTTIRSEGFGEVVFGDDIPTWAIYLEKMRSHMAADGIEAPPFVATVATDIPTGASLSSSAAIEVAFGHAIAHLADAPIDGLRIAQYGQAVETELLGSPTGIMDQLISATGVAGAASLIDCRSLDARPCPIPPGSVVVVLDTMTRRELVESEFPARMQACRRAADLLGVAALRDIDDQSALTVLEAEHPIEFARASHVVAENRRTLAAEEAMASGDAAALGRLMNASHDSLSSLYEVSGPALDAMVEIARGAPGCFGARMTGGGFAGCAVALVDIDDVAAFVAEVERGYEAWSGRSPRLWPSEAAAGASVENLG
ncbi:MAG: galactokinase [Actinomycetota bacterium]